MPTSRRTVMAAGNSTQSGTGWGSGNVGGSFAVTPDWEILRDFNSGPNGSGVLYQPDGFDDEAQLSVYSNEQVYSGAFSCKMNVLAGTTGGGPNGWGGRLIFPSALAKGDVLWYEHYYYMPSAFSVQTAPGWLKYIRFWTQTAAAAMNGHLDVYIDDDDTGDPAETFRWIMEGQGKWARAGGNRRYLRDQWVRQTVRVDFSDVPVALGGTGRVRHWENGTMVFDSSVTIGADSTWLRTLNNATDVCTYHRLHTYWNNVAPLTQSSYVDDIRIAKNGRPTWTLDLPEAD